jgi:hypothetical protein
MNEIINLENHTSSQSDSNQDNNSASEPKFKTVPQITYTRSDTRERC